MNSKILKDMFTGIDGQSHDLGKYLWVLSVLAGIVYAGVDLFVLHSKFDITQYGIGIGTLLGAGGAMLSTRSDAMVKRRNGEAANAPAALKAKSIERCAGHTNHFAPFPRFTGDKRGEFPRRAAAAFNSRIE